MPSINVQGIRNDKAVPGLRIRPDEFPSVTSTGDKLFQAFVIRTLLVGRNPIINHDDGDGELIKDRSQFLWRGEAIFGIAPEPVTTRQDRLAAEHIAARARLAKRYRGDQAPFPRRIGGYQPNLWDV